MAGLLAILVLALGGACDGPPRITFDPAGPEITASRAEARLANADALARLTDGTVTDASARIDSCVRGADTWTNRDEWSLRCFYRSATAYRADDITTAAQRLGQGLTSLGCEDPDRLTRLLAQWESVNPGEPGPGTSGFRPGVVPDQVLSCGGLEVWTRISSADDPLLDLVAVAAANTQDPVVVSTRAFSADEITELGTADRGAVVVFVTVVSLYHEELR